MSSWRWKVFGAAAVCFAAALVDGGLAGGDMVHLLRGLIDRRAIITSAPYCASGLILAPMAASIGIVFLFSKQATPQEMKLASKRKMPWVRRYLAFVLASLIAALFAPIAQRLIVGNLALGRGYVACPRPDWPRRQPDRWARPGPHGATERCPGRGADPNL